MNESRAVAGATMEVADIARILRLLPHRYPFLLIDRIIEMRGDEFGIGVKNVTINEPYFQGHFPGNPVMPGVLQIEGMAQTAGTMCMSHGEFEGTPTVVYFMTIDKARFRRPVVPGDTLHYRLTKIRHRFNVWKYRGEAMVGDTMVAEAELSAMLSESR